VRHVETQRDNPFVDKAVCPHEVDAIYHAILAGQEKPAAEQQKPTR
jgi:hypothetical protein